MYKQIREKINNFIYIRKVIDYGVYPTLLRNLKKRGKEN